MKEAFTQVELIFSIVIIGILASFTAEKLNTTRDDAKVATCLQNVTIFITDVSAYYTSQGRFSTNIKEMTSVEVDKIKDINENGTDGEYSYSCDDKSSPTVFFNFSKIYPTNTSPYLNLKVTTQTDVQGSVDGDLGYLLGVKNLAYKHGKNYAISGISVKR
jgi:type II secretory pathway pseudopilin PulG